MMPPPQLAQTPPRARRRVRVVVVDDSALARKLLCAMLGADRGIEVVGVASDPLTARTVIRTTNPDVITLDVEMPHMDGVTFLEQIMRLRPTPVLMVSSLTDEGADVTLRALELGAVDFVTKPTIDIARGLEDKRGELIAKVKAAAASQPRALALTAPPPAPAPAFRTTDRIVAIGASTGGVDALRRIVCALPADGPAVCVVQHMPSGFTRRFAERLNAAAQVTVVEAQDGQRCLPGHVYIAPGDLHLRLARSGGQYQCRVTDDAPIGGHRPSVDALFRSVAAQAGTNAVGVILTGMGNDGAAALRLMREAGARTLGQDAASCVVYGMPKAAAAAGATEAELPIDEIAATIVRLCNATDSQKRRKC